MKQMIYSEVVWNLNHLYGVVDQEYKKSLDEAFKALKTMEQIKDIVANADAMIMETYGAVIVEGYADMFSKIRETLISQT